MFLCRKSTNLSAFVWAMRDECVLYNDHHQNIGNRILIGRIFHFRRCQMILWRSEMESFYRAWFGCCSNGRIPADDYEIPTCNSNDVTGSAVGLTQAASRWKQVRAHAPKRREYLLFKISWAQISSWDARFIFSLHMHWGDPRDGCSCNHRQHGRDRQWTDFNISVGVP